MRVVAVAFVALSIHGGCTAPGDENQSTTTLTSVGHRLSSSGQVPPDPALLTVQPQLTPPSDPPIDPPTSSYLGATSLTISSYAPEGYWRLNDRQSALEYSGTMVDSSSNQYNGQYNDVVDGVPGALVDEDENTAAEFQAFDNSYAAVADHKNYSLTRTWDEFNQYGSSFEGETWGINPNNEPWMNEVTNQGDYGVSLDQINGDSAAFIDPMGAQGSFQQGIPTTTLLHGEMQIRAEWEDTKGATGVLAPVGLVAQQPTVVIQIDPQVDVSNQVRAELLENVADHTMEIDLVQVVNGENTYLAESSLDTTHNPGDLWYLRFRFDGTALAARAWRTNSSEPATSQTEPITWQVTGTTSTAVVGSTAVRYETSNSSEQPIVYYDDFWVQTTGFSVGYFINVPDLGSAYGGQSGSNVYPLAKATETGSFGEPYAPGFPNGNQEYFFRLESQCEESDTGCGAGAAGEGLGLTAYVFNPEGGYGTGIGIFNVIFGKWYYVMMELDPGDYNDGSAGLTLYSNGKMLGHGTYKGDTACPGHCEPNGNGQETTCYGRSGADQILCYDITPLNGSAPFELGRADGKD